MIPLPPLRRIFLACGATDIRKGFDGLAVLVQQALEQSPHPGALFAFRGKWGDLVKLLCFDGQGMSLFSKRPGRFIPPSTIAGSVAMNGTAFDVGRYRLAAAGAHLSHLRWQAKKARTPALF